VNVIIFVVIIMIVFAQNFLTQDSFAHSDVLTLSRLA